MSSVFRRYCDARCAAAYLLVLCLCHAWLKTPPTSPLSPAPGAPRDSGGNATARPLNVTLTHLSSRGDRLGSAIQLPLGGWLVARFHGWAYCSPPSRFAAALAFPMCDGGAHLTPRAMATMLSSTEGSMFDYRDDGLTQPGVYYINPDGNKNTLWSSIQAKAMYTRGAVEDWRRMILGAQLRPELAGELWLHADSVRIAAHVRRGDIGPSRNDVWVADEKVIALIEIAKYYVRMKRGPDVNIEVHVFSESYGTTNWTRYAGHVDAFHLAPNTGLHPAQSDLDLSLRDWQHFVRADVLLVGGTFSRVPALARPDPGPDGLPATLFFQWRNFRSTFVHWTGRNRDAVVAEFPGGALRATVGRGAAAPVVEVVGR